MSKFIGLIVALHVFNLYGQAAFDVFNGKTEIKDPLSLRDPFSFDKVSKIQTREKKSDVVEKYKVKDGLYSNDLVMGEVDLTTLLVTGVLIGENRRAIVRAADSKQQFIIKEGDKIGFNGAEVKAIVPAGVVVVEEVENIYGEREFLEAVIPLSKE